MKIVNKNKLLKFSVFILLIVNLLFASSCVFDPDEAVNMKDLVSYEPVVGKDSTVFYFYYESEEHPIDDFEIIKVELDYYVDYYTTMKKKDFYISVPDDVKYEEQTYFTVEIEHALTNQSVVYVSVAGNYKTEDKSRDWTYVVTVIIGIVMLLIFCPLYTVFCDGLDSNSALPSFVWLGGLIIYGVVMLIIRANWGNGPGGIIIGSAALYFIFTLFTYFRYKR